MAAERRPRVGRLWAPWRMEYIRKASRPKGGDDDLFVRVARSRTDRAHLVLARRGTGLLMMNRYPYSPGHLMAAPFRKVATFTALTSAERLDLLELIALGERALERAMQPQGMNIGVNLGRVAGAGVLGHLHVHLVPRWHGDTNFMPVVGETRVLPESLGRTWTRLAAAIAADAPAPRRRPPGKRRGA